jgi:hypothetical protein
MTRHQKEKRGRSAGTSVRDEAFAGDKPGLTETVKQQQHTGNHDEKRREKGGADRFGGTRAGSENVE